MTFFSSATHAYKIGVYTDQLNSKMAKDVIGIFKNTYPFNTLDIDFIVMPVDSAFLKCEADSNIERLQHCDSDNVANDAAKKGIDQAMVIKDSKQFGGGATVGSGIPVVTTASPVRTLIHEYLHTLGFWDEYKYKSSETFIVCKDTRGAPNVAVITPDPNGYAGDLSARGKHMGQIPWGHMILQNTLITNHNGRSLGTAEVGSKRAKLNSTEAPSTKGEAIGLYEGKTCKNATPKLVTWQPGKEASVMEFIDAGLGAGNERAVLNILFKRGVRSKIETASISDFRVNNTFVRRAKVVDDKETDSNNSTYTIPR